jgi:hypothetical protein
MGRNNDALENEQDRPGRHALFHAGEHRDYFGVRDAMLKGAARGDGPLEALLA